MDTKPLTVEAPTYPQLAKLIEERVLAATTKRKIGANVFQSALRYPGTELEDVIAALVLKLANAFLFVEQIKACAFDYYSGLANPSGLAASPKDIEGQVSHIPTGETELAHPGKTLTTKQVWERYGDGDLSELFDHAARRPEDQREFPIAIIWKVDDQFWYASLSSDGTRRGLNIDRIRSGFLWIDRFRFLRRKSAGAKA
jgi:hypothetical protein